MLFLLIISLLLFFPSPVYSFDGPLQIKNRFPIFLHADQPYLEKASMENSFSASLSHSSTYTVQESGRWLINLDMEITELNLRYRRIIRDFFELDIEVPLLGFSDGFMDGFLDAYHNIFGFSDYGRSARPLHDFLYEVRRNGALVIEGDTGMGLGDVRLAVKKPLISSDDCSLSVKGDIEFPTGNAKRGYGNGSTDAGISVLLDKSISGNVMTSWNFGMVVPGDVKGHRRLDLKSFIYGGVGLEVALRKTFSILIQIQGQSAIYPETELLAVDRAAYLFAFGGRYYSGNSSFELSLTEDLNTSGAPDFIMNLSYKIKL